MPPLPAGRPWRQRFVRGDAEAAAARAVAEASDGAAFPALARLAASGGNAAADAAWLALVSLLVGHRDDKARAALAQRYAAIDGAVEGLIKAVMRRATPLRAIQASSHLIADGGPEVSAQFAAAGGFCARLVSFVAAVGDSPWQACDDRLPSCYAALECIPALIFNQPAAVASALMAAEGLWAALEGFMTRAGSSKGVARAVNNAMVVVAMLAAQSPAAARRAAGLDGLLAGLAAALAEPFFRQGADNALRAIATRGGGGGKAAVAAAVAGALACAADDGSKKRLREWLAAPPVRMGAGAIGALELQAVQAEALRARVAELEAIPVNTRAAIVELAHAVRGARLEEGEEAAAGEE
ncbi:hypothetical protein Rsub_00658 [Raphidocelis subcapitata]|uniref:Uncharacterized protein n=1 Tax=Raphidocelis subcapitata TaxID=307507 RepID=A0A2V0NKR9_9CHLO|nr:hypothetical protein Rsub_00658 [Raphidocelis subcapitata]|eukprot:GBF87946.1 hypothetical protein Rsub_00658 [Raphidocelis subcapitata]